MPSRIGDDFLDELQRSTDVHRLRWTPYLTPGGRQDAERVREYPVRFTDIDLFDHMNNAVYWSVVEEFLSTRPELLGSPLRVTLEHEAPIALGDKLDPGPHPPGRFHRQVRHRTGRPRGEDAHVCRRRPNQSHCRGRRPLAARPDRAHALTEGAAASTAGKGAADDR